jgi:hypothetical protein
MKTTILGLLAAVAATIQTTVQDGHSLVDWKTWILPVSLAILGYLSNDSTTNTPRR